MGQQKQGSAEYAHEALREMLRAGELRPGQAVIETEVAARLGLSRTPIREALIQLEQEGLLRTVGSRTKVVAELTLHDALELYDLREMAEGLAARLVAPRAGLELLAELESLAASDSAFHRRLLVASGNARLRQLGDTLALQWALLRRQLGAATQPDRAAHAELLAALRSGDADQAEAVARLHVFHEKERLMRAVLSGELVWGNTSLAEAA